VKKIKYFFLGVMREFVLIALFLVPLFFCIVDIKKYIFDVWGIRLQLWSVLLLYFIIVVVFLFLVFLLAGIMVFCLFGSASLFSILRKIVTFQKESN
jgi:hypothetical protein